MRSLFTLTLLSLHLIASASGQSVEPSTETLDRVLAEFQEYSGAELVFRRDDLPAGRYHDVLKPLPTAGLAQAASACLREVRMYPPGYFGQLGLRKIGFFAACVSRTSDGARRTRDPQLGGYRYFGVYNGHDAIAIAMYSDGQMALTFHHETFHHIDSTENGETAAWILGSDDAFYRAALRGDRPRRPPTIMPEDLEALKKARKGFVLKEIVSEYAARNPREDQAETARHLMSMLPDSLVQCIEQPNLAGSQRLLHVIGEMKSSVPGGPDFDWLVDVALERADRQTYALPTQELIRRLQEFVAGEAASNQSEAKAVRAIIRELPKRCDHAGTFDIAMAIAFAAQATTKLIIDRICEDGNQRLFQINGMEDKNGVNRTLRTDVRCFGEDAKRLALILEAFSDEIDSNRRLRRLVFSDQELAINLLNDYLASIEAHWSVTNGTRSVFERALESMEFALLDDVSNIETD